MMLKTMKRISFELILLLGLIIPTIAMPEENRPSPITDQPWQEVVISVYDADISARFFTEIAGYEVVWRGAESPEFLSHLGLNKAASGQSNFKAASSLCRRKLTKQKLKPTKFRLKLILCQNCCKLRLKRAIVAKNHYFLHQSRGTFLMKFSDRNLHDLVEKSYN